MRKTLNMKKTKEQERIDLLESKLNWAYEAIIDLRCEVRNLNEQVSKPMAILSAEPEKKDSVSLELFYSFTLPVIVVLITIVFLVQCK